MIAVYKTRSAGPYHIKNGIPCQDAYAIAKSETGYVIMAVADGVGSSKNSDIASQLAADSVVSVCKGKLTEGMSDEETIEIIKAAFLVADANISKTAEEDDGNYDDYDTTLCLAVYDGEKLFYGQSGDSGLVALAESGEYLQVTSQQRDSENHVFPLCFGTDYWEFGKVDKPISAFVLVTDGIWEQIFSKLLVKESVKMNVSLLERMLNYFDIEENEIPELENRMQNYWENCPAYLIDDDKTSIGVINTNRPPKRKEETYYKEPNWNELIEKANNKREKTKERLYANLDKRDKEQKDLDDECNDASVGVQKENDVSCVEEDIETETKDVIETIKEERLFIPLVSQSITRMVDQMRTLSETTKIDKGNNEKSSKKANALPTKIDIKI